MVVPRLGSTAALSAQSGAWLPAHWEGGQGQGEASHWTVSSLRQGKVSPAALQGQCGRHRTGWCGFGSEFYLAGEKKSHLPYLTFLNFIFKNFIFKIKIINFTGKFFNWANVFLFLTFQSWIRNRSRVLAISNPHITIRYYYSKKWHKSSNKTLFPWFLESVGQHFFSPSENPGFLHITIEFSQSCLIVENHHASSGRPTYNFAQKRFTCNFSRRDILQKESLLKITDSKLKLWTAVISPNPLLLKHEPVHHGVHIMIHCALR